MGKRISWEDIEKRISGWVKMIKEEALGRVDKLIVIQYNLE